MTAEAVIVLVRDPDGFGPAIAGALHPGPGSALTREVASLELSLEKYGIGDYAAAAAAVEWVRFVDPQGSPQVSILLVPNYEPPVAACAINETVALIMSEKFSHPPAIIVPFITKMLKLDHETKNQTSACKGALYGAGIGATTDLTQAMLAEIAKAPPSLRIHNEPIACLMRMVHVLNLPTVLLVATISENKTKEDPGHDLEVLFEVGQFIASCLSLCFSRDKIQLNHVKRSSITQEPWRALYG